MPSLDQIYNLVCSEEIQQASNVGPQVITKGMAMHVQGVQNYGYSRQGNQEGRNEYKTREIQRKSQKGIALIAIGTLISERLPINRLAIPQCINYTSPIKI